MKARLPTYLWVEAEVRRLSSEGVGVYITAHGDRTGGLVLQKIADMKGQCRLLAQQRDLDGRLSWVHALDWELVPEADADAYIGRSVARDPDLWVIEIEDRTLTRQLGAPA